MQRDSLSRRSVLSLAGLSLASAGVATGAQTSYHSQSAPGATDDEHVTRESFQIMEGTEKETTVYVTDAEADGPTVFVIGGVHGNETAGYIAAEEIAEWTIDAGTLVTLPRADVVAIDRGTRVDDDGIDLNRQFPEGSEPQTELAEAIWDLVVNLDPAVIVDLHESRGIYAGNPVDGVGQAIFHANRDEDRTAADSAIEYVNDNYIDVSERAFQTGYFSGPDSEPTGLLVHKAARELGSEAFLVETLSTENELEKRVTWHSAIVERLVEDELFPNEEPNNGHEPEEPIEEEPDEPDEPPADEDDDESGDDVPDDHTDPVAEIRSDPSSATERTLEPEQTITLDATCSEAPDGELVSYEWSIKNDGTFNESGKTVDVTVSASGDHRVLLRVTDDAGASETTEVTLTAA
ncbi:succinylglutamate desuccinylase/aspartoacylase family protein / PKD domain protein [Natrialba magadii ATCC 43099]|uniref:Succinylglutamate desuccinylase/aspartoacylase family protein / PKD domain protein n=1 Tax=Natrialba magadii (strain ATCC 43099 / DSM 3394 / CCM 3739 / CIP 104546 / IAM 13178 / JCM 8861 / NBRC 102185 / NCIMB 2190 / MS3) TaxID=547559 RepID=D3SSI2_NATMM|nr:PKD domain-containing protein [Natrialba magadii]ADD06827.1 succinylglutamate desuccinylase/aspartoacylase family protein / PKD domain protein [Natrialba magadii ATCC 43099]